MSHEETVSFGQAVLKLTFDPGSPDDGMLTAECRLDHPFFVKSKGIIIPLKNNSQIQNKYKWEEKKDFKAIFEIRLFSCK